MSWFNKDVKFSKMLMQEIDKNVFVWFVDDSNFVRAFDLGTEYFSVSQSHFYYFFTLIWIETCYI